MIRISRNKQIIFYLTLLIFGVFFFFYFYKQASVIEGDFLEVKIGGDQPVAPVGREGGNIDFTLFSSDKFRSLQADVAPIQSFQSGKRNPFMPY
jgi:hypothetical protein